MKKVIKGLTFTMCLALIAGLVLPMFRASAYAYQPDKAYVYDGEEMAESEAVPSTNAYQVSQIVNENVMGCSRLNAPQDIFVDSNDQIYILDSGNCRVLILDETYRCVKELVEFTYKGEVLTLAKGADGLFYRESNECLYIADTENNRILVSDLKGNVSRVYEKPVDELLDPATAYKPSKIIVDNMGIMYVVSANINTGAMLVDSENNFLGFYGTNKIKESADVLLEYMWRSILTEEQNAQSGESFQPAEFNNIFWTEDRFVYAVSPVSETVESSVVKLNSLGNDVFPKTIEFKDAIVEETAESGNTVKGATMQLSDITVDDEGVITVVDMMNGKLYQYDEECNLLAAFGGTGYQEGLFTRPVAIETDSNHNLLVLDEVKNTLTVLQQTYYGQIIREANYLYNQGLYQESIEPWFEVLRMNANYYLAYVGMGKAYMSMEEYELAKEYFELGGDQEGYGEAKAALRNEMIRENFAVIAAIVFILMVVILGYDFFKKQTKNLARYIKNRKGAEKL